MAGEQSERFVQKNLGGASQRQEWPRQARKLRMEEPSRQRRRNRRRERREDDDSRGQDSQVEDRSFNVGNRERQRENADKQRRRRDRGADGETERRRQDHQKPRQAVAPALHRWAIGKGFRKT